MTSDQVSEILLRPFSGMMICHFAGHAGEISQQLPDGLEQNLVNTFMVLKGCIIIIMMIP